MYIFETKKMSLIDIKEDLNKWISILYSRIRRFNTVNMAIPSKLIYKFNTISIKTSSENKNKQTKKPHQVYCENLRGSPKIYIQMHRT